MRKLILIPFLFLVGCHSKGLEKLLHQGGDDLVIQDTWKSPYQVSPDAPIVTVNIVVSGQSNARNEKIWETLNNLTEQYLKVHLYVVNIASSNTDSWKWKQSPLVDSLALAVASHHPKYVLIIQGEGDGYTTPNEYFDNYTSIFSQAGIGSSNPTPYMALCSYYGGGDYKRESVRQGQALIFQNGLAKQGPDVDQYRPTMAGDNGLHFTDLGAYYIGRDWFDILAQELIKERGTL